MTFADYPVDTQNCEIVFESWGTPQELLKFRWKEGDSVVNDQISLNQHEFEVSFENQNETGAFAFSTGKFTSVTLRLKLKRKLEYHLLRTYLPSTLFVVIAWFSMFIPLEHVPGI